MYASTTTAAFGAEDFAVFRPVATMPNGDGDGAGSDGDEPHHRDGGDGDDRGYGGHGGKGYGDDWRGDWRHGKLASRLSLFYVVFLGGLFVASKFKPIPNLCTVVASYHPRKGWNHGGGGGGGGKKGHGKKGQHGKSRRPIPLPPASIQIIPPRPKLRPTTPPSGINLPTQLGNGQWMHALIFFPQHALPAGPPEEGPTEDCYCLKL